MKRFTLTGFALVLAAFFGMVQFGSPTAFARSEAAGQTVQAGQQAQQPAQSPHQAKMTHPRHAQIFVGTISKKNGKYELVAGALSYKLSNQSKAEKYNGKEVEVFGKLKPKTETIHVKKIKSLGSS